MREPDRMLRAPCWDRDRPVVVAPCGATRLTSLVRVGDLGWHQIRVSGRSVGARGPSALWGGGIGDHARSRRARASSIQNTVNRGAVS